MKNIRNLTPAILLLLLQACSDESANGNSGKASQQMVITTTAVLRDSQISESLTGTLQAQRTAKIHNQQAGIVTRIHAFPGDRVNQGALLARFDDKLLAAQRDKANAILEQARLDLQRAEKLASSQLIADDALARTRTGFAIAQADAKLAQAQFDYSRISAPFAGVLSERMVDEGDVVAAQTQLFTLLDTRSLKAQIFVTENLLPQLDVNDAVSLTIESDSNQNSVQTFKGRISRVPPGLDPDTRQAEIEIEISPAPATAMPGQLCRVTLQGKKISRLMIDFDALRHDNLGAFVYVLHDNTVRRTTVQSGMQQDGYIEIVRGINAGDVVISKGFTGLHDGQTVAIANATTASDKKEKEKGKENANERK